MKLIKQGDTVLEWYGDDIMQALESERKRALTESGIEVMGKAVTKIHNVSGNLANSITYDVMNDGVEIGTNVDYAPYVEYGTGIYAEKGNGRKTSWVFKLPDGTFRRTRGARPRPFLRPALDESISRILGFFRDAIERSIRSGGRD